MRGSYSRKTDCIDEKRAFEKAKRRKEEAEAKVRLVKKWSSMLDHTIGKKLGPCKSFSILLDHLTPKALSRLDQMLLKLDEYFRTTPEKQS